MDEGYPDYFARLNGLRGRIARDVPSPNGARVLDLATGHGFLAMEFARLHGGLRITGIDISMQDLLAARENIAREGFADRINLVRMDATEMAFPEGVFGATINFLPGFFSEV